ncbi:MAG: cell division protein FtsQ [Proteobacteria bacterium]|nr:cell division protein FtsQ [Pseudomonadota bacterium]
MWNKPHLLNALADLLILAAAAALLAAAAVWLVRVPSLPVRQVEFVEPLAHTRRVEVEQILAGSLKGNFFSLNLESVRGALEMLPWVRKVEVRRIWPAKLQVKVEEHRPLARWGEGRGELVNSYGEVFAALPGEQELVALPLLAGPAGTASEVLTHFSEYVGAFKAVGERPFQLTLSPRLAWQLKLENGMVVDMGREQPKSPVALRLQRFIEVYPETVAKRAVRPAVVDLRYPNGFAMKVVGEGKGK